jgi:16S rRNA G966 N2-methylase RsmD
MTNPAQGALAPDSVFTRALLRIEERSPAELQPHPTNPRKHSPAQIALIKRSIQTFGFTNPVLLGDDDSILAGHGRVEAAKQLGLAQVPTVRLSGMSPAQRRAYVIADNKLAELARWDDELLRLELGDIIQLDDTFDLTLTGFSVGEIDVLLDGDKSNEEEAGAPQQGPAVSRRGDLWQLGEHRVLCGDALVLADYATVMAGKKARMVFTDPPYNVPIGGHVSGLGKVTHGEFAMASGEMDAAQFTAFLRQAFRLMVEHSMDGAIGFVAMDWRHLGELLAAGADSFSELKNLCVWTKTNAGMGSLYRSQHELFAVFKVGHAAHLNNVNLGKHGRNRTNVWAYAGATSFGAGRLEDLHAHPTVKPVELVADAIRDVSKRGDLVLDPFGGSGSTLLAAEKTRRCARVIEIDPGYVDLIVSRWQRASGEQATLVGDGRDFEEVKAERLGAREGGDVQR